MAGQTIGFGSGNLFAKVINADGSASTPRKLGILQSVEVTFESELKTLMGEYQMPVAVARGAMTVSGNAEYATINSDVYNEVFFGLKSTTGYEKYQEESATLTADELTVTVNEAATFGSDKGVVTAVGIPFQNVTGKTSALATFEYTVDAATGTYTFAAVDAGKTIVIRYASIEAGGKQTELKQQLMGEQPEFSISLFGKYQGNIFGYELYRCVATNWNISRTNDDFTIPNLQFSAFADESGSLGKIFSSSTY